MGWDNADLINSHEGGVHDASRKDCSIKCLLKLASLTCNDSFIYGFSNSPVKTCVAGPVM